MKGALKEAGFLLLIGIAYYLWIRRTGIVIPCVFYRLTGWRCPGCGVTTLIVRLLRFDFSAAYAANPFLFVTAPFLLFEGIYTWIRTARQKKEPVWNKVLVCLYLAALVVFGVCRNL